LDRGLVDIESHERCKIAHDRLPSYAALAPLALTRDPMTPPGSPLGLLNEPEFTIASRSFHLV
jgi:hypothetical protein